MSDKSKIDPPPGYWPCCCVKRDRKGNLAKIKLNPPARKRCRVCKAEKPEVLSFSTTAEIWDCPPDYASDRAPNYDCYERYHMVSVGDDHDPENWHPFAFKRRSDASRWARRHGYKPVHWYAF